MSGQTQGGLPFDTSGAGGQLPGYTNSPTPAPGSTYLGTQLNNLFNQLYGQQNQQTNNQMMGAGNPQVTNGFTLPPMISPTPQAYSGINQNAGGQQQQTGMSLGGLMNGTAAPVAGPVASAPSPAPNPVTTTPVAPTQPPVIQGPPAQPGPVMVNPAPAPANPVAPAPAPANPVAPQGPPAQPGPIQQPVSTGTDWSKYQTTLDKNIFQNGQQYGMGTNINGQLAGLDANGNPVYYGSSGMTWAQDPNAQPQSDGQGGMMIQGPGAMSGARMIGYYDQNGQYLGFDPSLIATQYQPGGQATTGTTL